MALLTIGTMVLKDLRRVVGDRRALVVNLVLPLLLTFIMGLSFGGGIFGDTGISAIEVALVGEGVPAPLRDRVAEALQETDFFAVTWTDSLTADRMVRQGDVAAALVLPPDLAESFFGGDPVALQVWKDPGSELKAGIVEEVVARGLARYQAGEAAYEALWPREDHEPPAPGGLTWEEFFAGDAADVWRRWRDLQDDPALAAAGDRLLEIVDRQFALADALQVEAVVLHVEAKAAADRPAEPGDVNLFDYFLPTFAVFFLMFGVAAGARDLHRERTRGTLQRQLLSPVSARQLLAAKWLTTALQGAGQLGVLFLAGALLFRVNLGPDPFSLAAVVLATTLTAAGLFQLLALLSPTEKIMDNLSTTVVLISALLGGNMVPLEAMPAWAHSVGRFVFNYWANRGFAEVIARDHSVRAAPEPVLILVAAAAVLLAACQLLGSLRQRRGGLA